MAHKRCCGWLVFGVVALCGASSLSAEEAKLAALSAEVEPWVVEENEAIRSQTVGGMGVLLGWSVSNMAVGTVGRSRNEGTRRYFHEMNAAWNAVNFGIGAAGMVGALRDEPGDRSAGESLRRSHNREKLFLVNLGLNVAYVATGFGLTERGKRRDDDRLEGYGASMMVQGGFLVAFDAAMYLIQRRSTRRIEGHMW